MELIYYCCAVVLSVGYVSILEYVVHRWVMHFPGLGRHSWWRDHAVEHHGRARNDVNITLSSSMMVVGMLPLFIFSTVYGWPWTAFVLFECIAYASFWSALHAAYHSVGSGGTVLRRLRWFETWQQHHMQHHKHPSQNFGAVFIWTDRIFGTKAK
jgi:hypothetical protein